MGWNLERRRQIVHDGIEQRLDALVLERRAADDGDERRASPRTDSIVRFRQRRLDAIFRNLLPCRYISRIWSSTSLTFSMSCSR